MTWNIADGICSTNFKTEAFNNWTALAVTVAALKPDILFLQEAGDNEGNCTGSEKDQIVDLQLTLELFIHGGLDPFHNNHPVTAYVQKYAPEYDLPYFFASTLTDDYNRNVIASRYRSRDLNGDTRAEISDLFPILPHGYAPGGNGGIRGVQFVELDLPDDIYPGDLVVGNVHLKAGNEPGDRIERLTAARNTAYFIDHFYNGSDFHLPDPFQKIKDRPPATSILSNLTPVIVGGDFNEDENDHPRAGPALWLVRAQWTNKESPDGTDRDRTDSVFDQATHPITGFSGTHISGRKYDYITWQDSIARCRRTFVFDVNFLDETQMPEEIKFFPVPIFTSSTASDHKPVIADLILPGKPPSPEILQEMSHGFSTGGPVERMVKKR